jgi:hypothetical protein
VEATTNNLRIPEIKISAGVVKVAIGERAFDECDFAQHETFSFELLVSMSFHIIPSGLSGLKGVD